MERSLAVPSTRPPRSQGVRLKRLGQPQQRPKRLRHRRRRGVERKRSLENDVPEGLDAQQVPIALRGCLCNLWNRVRGAHKYFREVYPPLVCDEDQLQRRLLADFGLRLRDVECIRLVKWLRSLDTAKHQVRYGRVVRVAIKLGAALQRLREPRSHLGSPASKVSKSSLLEALRNAALRHGDFLTQEVRRLRQQRSDKGESQVVDTQEFRTRVRKGLGLHVAQQEDWQFLLKHLMLEGDSIDLLVAYERICAKIPHIKSHLAPERPANTKLPKPMARKPVARKPAKSQARLGDERSSLVPGKGDVSVQDAGPVRSGVGTDRAKSGKGVKVRAKRREEQATILMIQAEAEAQARTMAEQARRQRTYREEARRRFVGSTEKPPAAASTHASIPKADAGLAARPEREAERVETQRKLSQDRAQQPGEAAWGEPIRSSRPQEQNKETSNQSKQPKLQDGNQAGHQDPPRRPSLAPIADDRDHAGARRDESEDESVLGGKRGKVSERVSQAAGLAAPGHQSPLELDVDESYADEEFDPASSADQCRASTIGDESGDFAPNEAATPNIKKSATRTETKEKAAVPQSRKTTTQQQDSKAPKTHDRNQRLSAEQGTSQKTIDDADQRRKSIQDEEQREEELFWAENEAEALDQERTAAREQRRSSREPLPDGCYFDDELDKGTQRPLLFLGRHAWPHETRHLKLRSWTPDRPEL
eukprot:scaffold7735_cov248-Pinguiococcus_pyrenoidosus.AAC.7